MAWADEEEEGEDSEEEEENFGDALGVDKRLQPCSQTNSSSDHVISASTVASSNQSLAAGTPSTTAATTSQSHIPARIRARQSTVPAGQTSEGSTTSVPIQQTISSNRVSAPSAIQNATNTLIPPTHATFEDMEIAVLGLMQENLALKGLLWLVGGVTSF